MHTHTHRCRVFYEYNHKHELTTCQLHYFCSCCCICWWLSVSWMVDRRYLQLTRQFYTMNSTLLWPRSQKMQSNGATGFVLSYSICLEWWITMIFGVRYPFTMAPWDSIPCILCVDDNEPRKNISTDCFLWQPITFLVEFTVNCIFFSCLQKKVITSVSMDRWIHP